MDRPEISNPTMRAWLRDSVWGDEEEWIRDASWGQFYGVVRPSFRHRCVSVAYDRTEAWLLSALREGRGVRSDLAAFVEAAVRRLRVVDSAWEEPTGYVYLLTPASEDEWDSFNAGKLGFSGDPRTRLKQVQTGCPVELDVHHFAPGTPQVEQALHHYLEQERAHGEWFRLDGEVVDLMGVLVNVARCELLLRKGAIP